MTFPSRLLISTGFLAFVAAPIFAETPLDDAEVRLPYAELRRLIEASRPQPETRVSMPASLLSSRLKLRLNDGGPVIEARFETMRFADELSRVPLIGGDISVVDSETAGMGLVVHEAMLCQIDAAAGKSETKANLRITSTGRDFTLSLPPCPGTILDLSDLPDGAALGLAIGGLERIVSAGSQVPLPAEAGVVSIRLLDTEESTEALRPPEPSKWEWQHQALVAPVEGELEYRVLSHASAVDGSALEATLLLPPDARKVTATGDDLLDVRVGRDPEGNPLLDLTWKSRDLMERELEVAYVTSVRPLDKLWTLRVPKGDESEKANVRYFLPSSPQMVYSADGMSERIAFESIPSSLSRFLTSSSCYVVEGGPAVEIGVSRLPVVATDEAKITAADWLLGLEPDGSMLAEGRLSVEHGGAQGVLLVVPDGMDLLSCRVDDAAVEPINRGEGRIEVPLVSQRAGKDAKASISISFTGKSEPFDPLEGMIAYPLPSTPLFIRELTWRIDLPSGYSAETSGNLTRVQRLSSDPVSSVRLLKKLCRGEQPEVRVFYRSSNLLP